MKKKKIENLNLKIMKKNRPKYHEILVRFVLVSVFLFSVDFVFSQDRGIITGTIIDGSDNTTLPGATIAIARTQRGTSSDIDGRFTLSDLPAGNVSLEISFVGYLNEQINVDLGAGEKKNITVMLMPSLQAMDEVVVVGYGTQKRVNITGSVVSVKSGDITRAPVGNVTHTLAGRLPGLFVKQEGGAPGLDAARLSIRGFGNALVIVDGVERRFDNLDPNEIESISVLKDGAAAIYGSRAGNGVILVTTKKGSFSKPVLTYNGSLNVTQPIAMMKPSSSGQFAEMQRESDLNRGVKPVWTEEEVALFYAGTDPDYPNANHIKEITTPYQPMRQHNLSVSGGSEKIKYYALLGYLDQETLIKRNGGGFKRYNFRSNMEASITDNLKMLVNFSTVVGQRREASRQLNANLWTDLYGQQPIYASILPDPNRAPWAGTSSAFATSNRDISGYADRDEQTIQGSMALDWNIKWIEGLKARAFFDYLEDRNDFKSFSKKFNSYTYNYASDQYIRRTLGASTALTQQNTFSRQITGNFSLKYDRTFANVHDVSAFALYEIIDISGSNLWAQRTGFLSNEVDYLFAGSPTTQLNNGSAFEMGRASYAGRVNYGYKSKYLLESTLRYDASAKFPTNTRWGLFPSISLGWRLSEEDFMKNNLPSVDNLKLRASYSEAGYDAIGNFQYLSGYRFNRPYAIGNIAQLALYDIGLPNPDLTWETMTTYNLGLEMALWNSKLYGEFDVFYRKREGIMGTRATSLPSTFGASLPLENINSSDDRGFEAILGTQGSKKGVRYDISGNIAYSRSKWLAFDEPNYTDPDEIRLNKRTGQWLDRVIGYVSDGLFGSQEEINSLPYNQDNQNNRTLRPGDIKYKDLNGDGIIDWRDQAELGKGAFPNWMFGLNTDLSYKNIDFSVLFQGAFGYSNFLNTYGLTDVNTYNWRWTPENQDINAYVPRLGGAVSNNWDSDYRIHDIAYVRLKTLSLGYTLPFGLTNKINAQSVRFYLAAMNLFTLSNVSEFNIDPEAPATGAAAVGFAHSVRYYPVLRSFSFGVNISL